MQIPAETAVVHAPKSRAHSSAGERSLHTGEVQGSIPCAPTSFDLRTTRFAANPFVQGSLREVIAGSAQMTPRKLIVLTTSLTGGAIGLFAPVVVVKWLLQTEPEDA